MNINKALWVSVVFFYSGLAGACIPIFEDCSVSESVQIEKPECDISKINDQGWGKEYKFIKKLRGLNKKDQKIFVESLLPDAENGEPLIQAIVGQAYALGIAVDKDPVKGLYWIKRSVENGSVPGVSYLARYYRDGIGLQKDIQKAFELSCESALKGWRKSVNDIGVMYGKGVGVKKNNDLSFEWKLKAAEMGYDVAQANLGFMRSKTEHHGFTRG